MLPTWTEARGGTSSSTASRTQGLSAPASRRAVRRCARAVEHPPPFKKKKSYRPRPTFHVEWAFSLVVSPWLGSALLTERTFFLFFFFFFFC